MQFFATNILALVGALASVADATGSTVTISKIRDTSRSAVCGTRACCQPYCIIEWKDNKYCPGGWSTEVGGTCKMASTTTAGKIVKAGCGGMTYQWGSESLVFRAPDAINAWDASAIKKTSCPKPNSCKAPTTTCQISNP
ncbi:unnamed protein product [Fusarium equiseti]|uniref:Uncharacterized protein n=1 Tax=Fusarium equiseti TaxID=61235 RepID=A0A8J2NG81_FUSEQ|nr:unnamed protein product [Fusarium equiseti]